MKNKNVQISEELFLKLCKHFLFSQDFSADIKKGIEDKLNAKIKRDLYTNYKNAATDEERENARQKYLQHIEMSEDMKW